MYLRIQNYRYYIIKSIVLPINTQCLQNSAENGGRSVLTLGSLCLPCCVRDIKEEKFKVNDRTRFHKKNIKTTAMYLLITPVE